MIQLLAKLLKILSACPKKFFDILRSKGLTIKVESLKSIILDLINQFREGNKRMDAVTPWVAFKSLFSEQCIPVHRPANLPLTSRMGSVLDSVLGCFGFETKFGLI